MTEETPKLLSHIPNSGIVHLPGRRFPGVVMQGDSLFGHFQGLRQLLKQFKNQRDEENYYETLMMAQTIQTQLVHYERALEEQGMDLPYSGSIRDCMVADDYKEAEPTDSANPPSAVG